MDALVHTSYREGLARALSQSLIAGKPVVSYDVDGAREVAIDGETGFLIPPGDTGRLMRAPSVEFSADELGEAAFGWNIPNTVLVAALRQHVEVHKSIRLLTGTVETVIPEDDRIVARLADSTQISASLIAAADGRRSPCRAAAGRA